MPVSNYADSILQTLREPLLVLDSELRVKAASRSFYLKFKLTPEQTVGQLLIELGSGQWNVPELRKLLAGVLGEEKPFNDFAVENEFAGIGRRSMLLNGRRLQGGAVGGGGEWRGTAGSVGD